MRITIFWCNEEDIHFRQHERALEKRCVFLDISSVCDCFHSSWYLTSELGGVDIYGILLNEKCFFINPSNYNQNISRSLLSLLAPE